MPSQGSSVRSLQARRAAAKRWHKPLDDLDRDYAAEKLAVQIRATVDSFPPLTDAQRNRLASLLLGSGGRVA